MKSPLPENLVYLFWDYNIDEIDLINHKNFIIERMLEKGDFTAIKWLFDQYTPEEINMTMQNSKNISKKTYTLWNYFFNSNE